MLTRVQKQRAGKPVTALLPLPAMSVADFVLWLVNSRPLLRDPAALGLPVLVENRPQRLIQVLAVLQKGLAQNAFLHRADLAERTVAAPVADRGPRLETMHTDLFEREPDQQLGAFLEHAGAPVRRSDRKAPLGRAEAGLQLTQLEDPDRRVVAGERHGEARVGPGATLAVRPGDELLEAVHCRRRRRDETRNFLGRQQREE